MTRVGYRFTSWALVVGLLLLLSLTTSSAVVHELTHATHHTAGMHTSGICAWMCAAGHMLDTEPGTPPTRLALVTFERLPVARALLHQPVGTPTSRAPPSFSLSLI